MHHILKVGRDTKYFSQLLHAYTRNSIIKRLVNERGEVIEKEKDILNQTKTFYTKLYSWEDFEGTIASDRDFFFEDLSTLTRDSIENCEGEIFEGEFFAALKKMKLYKSPGNDGLTVEVYNAFWLDIQDLLIGAFNEAYVSEQLSASQKQAIIILIAKEGKDPHLVPNCRPISLSNIDYKLFLK